MLGKDIEKNALFIEVGEIVSAMDLVLVDCIKNETAQGIHMIVTVYSAEREVNTDDLAEVYNVIYPRYQVVFGDRDLTLEVSSPGLQRNFRNEYEFSVFSGKLVRVYSAKYSSWLEAYIEENDEQGVKLRDVLVVDTEERLDELVLPFSDIQKAKLAFRWEGK